MDTSAKPQSASHWSDTGGSVTVWKVQVRADRCVPVAISSRGRTISTKTRQEARRISMVAAEDGLFPLVEFLTAHGTANVLLRG